MYFFVRRKWSSDFESIILSRLFGMSVNFRRKIILILVLSVFSSVVVGQGQPPIPPPPSVRPFNPNDQPNENGVEFLKLANLAHGGAALDNLKTLRLTGKVRIDNLFYTIKILVDTVSGKVRRETRSVEKGSDYFYVEQIEGKKGWVFRADEKVDDTEDSAKNSELHAILNTGLLGLRRRSLENASVTLFNVDPVSQLKTVRAQINGQAYEWKFNDRNVLISESFADDRDETRSLFDDFRNVRGVKIPYRVAATLESFSINVTLLMIHDWTTVEVNPTLTAKDWAVPKPKKIAKK